MSMQDIRDVDCMDDLLKRRLVGGHVAGNVHSDLGISNNLNWQMAEITSACEIDGGVRIFYKNLNGEETHLDLPGEHKYVANVHGVVSLTRDGEGVDRMIALSGSKLRVGKPSYAVFSISPID